MFTSKFNKMYRHVIAQMNDDIMTKLGYGKQVEAKNNGICPQCNAKVDPTSFRDEVSAREFKISGLCQACQDEVFGTEEYEAEEEPTADLNETDWKVDEEDLPDDLNDYLHAEDPEDYRNDDYVNGDAQDFQDEEAQEETQEESEIATDEDIEATKDLQDQDEDLQDDDLEDFQDDDDLQDQDEDLCDLEDEDLQDDDLEDFQDDEFEDDQDEDIKDTDQDFEEEFQDQDLQDDDLCDMQDEEDEEVITESKKKVTRKSSKK